MSGRVRRAAERLATASFNRIENWGLRKQLRRIGSLLARPDQRQTCKENVFDMLQAQYPSRDFYHYDPTSVWERGVTRATHLVRLGELPEGRQVAEIGCGDAMVSAALAFYGCNTIAIDKEDWRDKRAKQVHFVLADPCLKLPLDDNIADVVFSYNTFEHLPNPATAFEEALRICKRGGMIHLDFDPLYCSPWGLHAYRTIHMPYAQFLFADELLDRKIAELGVIDLGVTRRRTLQPLNKWRLDQFLALWRRSDCNVETLETRTDTSHVDVIEKFPRAFMGRQLTAADVVTTGIIVSLRKA